MGGVREDLASHGIRHPGAGPGGGERGHGGAARLSPARGGQVGAGPGGARGGGGHARQLK